MRGLRTRNRPQRCMRCRLRYASGLMLAGMVALLICLMAAARFVPQAYAASSQAQTAGAPPPASMPSLQLVSPSSGQGPVGAHVTVSGSGWTSSSVSVGAAQSASSCASSSTWQTTFTTQQVSGGDFTATFIWPSSLSSGQYALCAISADTSTSSTPTATPGVSASQTFTVRSGSPPALSLSQAYVQAGQPVTITGTNFFGAPSGASVSVMLLANGNATSIGQADPGSDGSFTLQYTTNTATIGNVTIQAQSASEGGAPAALQATVQLNIVAAATPTATVAPTATATTSPTAQVVPTPKANDTGAGGNNTGLIVLLVVAIGLVLLALLGLIAFFLLRKRDGDGGPDGGYGYDPQNPQGYGAYGQGDSRYLQGVTGRQAQPGFFGPNDEYGPQEPFPMPPGRVSQWNEPPAEPGPDWQPRPMTGNRRPYSDPPATTLYGPEGQAGGDVQRPSGGDYSPADPWDQASGAADWGAPADPWSQRPPQERNPEPPRDPWNDPQDDGW